MIGSGIYIITPCAGLRTPDVLITRDTIETFAGAEVDASHAAYR